MNASARRRPVRWWVKAYTRGLPAELRTARRDEVDDDLWCQQEEAVATGRSARSLGAEMFVRLLLGVPADLSWAFANRRNADARARVEMTSSMSARVFGTFAVLAGLSWTVMMLFLVVLGMSAWTGPAAPFMVIFVLVGGLAFAAAALGLLWRYQEQLHYLGAVGGSLAGLGAIASALDGAAAVFLLPIGSAALAWDLSRICVLSRPLATVHALSAVAIVVALVDAFANGLPSVLGALLIAVPIDLDRDRSLTASRRAAGRGGEAGLTRCSARSGLPSPLSRCYS